MTRYDLDGRAILVTGGGTGIGRAAAEICAASGARVVVSGRRKPLLDEVVATVEATGGVAAAFAMDARSNTDNKAAVDFTVARFGRLDGAFNSAGIVGAFRTDLLALEEDVFDEVIATNLKGVWLAMKHQVGQFVTQGGGGSIVNASSIAGLIGTRVNTAYSASKHAVTGMTKSVALEYAKHGIRVNAICPGWIETPMTAPVNDAADQAMRDAIIARHPLGRAGQPEEIGGMVAWLLSDAASFVTGTAMPIDGGVCA